MFVVLERICLLSYWLETPEATLLIFPCPNTRKINQLSTVVSTNEKYMILKQMYSVLYTMVNITNTYSDTIPEIHIIMIVDIIFSREISTVHFMSYRSI